MWDKNRPDLVLLDLNLPEMDGLDIARAIRKQAETPLIMVTARVDETDRLVGLELGADDYIAKPFSPREVVARVRAVLRRSAQAVPEPSGILRIGNVVVDLEGHTVRRDGQEIDLTPMEFAILKSFISRPGRVLSRTQLLDQAQGMAYEGYERTIDAHIKNLRAKLEVDPRNPQYIQTVFGVGYRFMRDETPRADLQRSEDRGKMRLRLLVSFVLIVLVSITSTIFLARQGAARGVRDYFLHGGITSLELAGNLEQYYASQGSWQGVSALLEQAGTAGMQGMMGRGQGTGSGMGQRLRVADASGVVVADTAGEPGSSLSQVEQNSALELTNSLGATIGYLFVEGGMGYRQGDELPLLNRLNAAGLQAALIACSIALILAFFLAYQLGRPVQQLTRAALRLAKGDLNQQVKTGGGKELTSLGQAFNQMAAELKTGHG